MDLNMVEFQITFILQVVVQLLVLILHCHCSIIHSTFRIINQKCMSFLEKQCNGYTAEAFHLLEYYLVVTWVAKLQLWYSRWLQGCCQLVSVVPGFSCCQAVAGAYQVVGRWLLWYVQGIPGDPLLWCSLCTSVMVTQVGKFCHSFLQ